MKLRLLKLIFLFFLSLSIHAQQGWWTWVAGSNTPNSAGSFGTINVPNAANTPPALYQTFEWTDLNGNFWIFGGMDQNGNFFSALWMFDPTTNLWTWKKGPNTTNAIGTYGTKGTAAPANNPGSRLCGLSWVDGNGDLWMWGGYGFANTNGWTNLADLWKYNIASNQWTWMAGPNTANSTGVYGVQGTPAPANYPPPRSETNAAWVDNNNNLWMFGGFSYTTINNWYNDLWKYDVTLNQWVWMKGSNTTNAAGNWGTMGTSAASNVPSARETFAKWKDINGNFWLFGAGQASALGTIYNGLNDLWKYDPTTNEWTWVRGSNVINSNGNAGTKCVSSPSNDPSARWENKACWTDTCGNFWMFGGQGKNTNAEYLNDLWYYDVQANEWMWVNGVTTFNNMGNYGTKGLPAAANMPRSRGGAAAFLHKNTDLYLFGGINQSPVTSQSYNDMWRFVIDTNCVKISCSTSNPLANFNSLLSGCLPFTVTFNNTSINSNSWSWNFGDGNTSTSQTPTNTYQNPGQYTVTLIASDGTNSDTLIMPNYITVYANAVATFTSNKDTLCTGDSVSFTNNSTNSNASSWNFGDGGTSTQTSPTHTYNTPGNFTVTLIAQNANGCNDTITQNIFVSGAQITAGNPLNLNCITTNGNISVSSTTPNVTYNWSGPGIISGGNTSTANVNAAGTYTCTVTDPISGCTNTATVIVNSNTTPPTITAGNTLALNCIITNGTINANSSTAGITYNWTGPGIVSGNTSSSPTVNAAGTYTVIVTDPSNGCTNSTTINVTKNDTIPNLTVGPPVTLSCYPDTITATSTTNGITYNWNGFGIIIGGNTSNAIINMPGTYTVIVTNPANGCTATGTVVVNGTPLPVAGVNSSVTITLGDSTDLLATGGPSYNWIPANAGLSCTNCANPIAKPNETTTYCVEVTDSNGCKDTACVTVYVEIPCPAIENLGIIPNAFSPNNDLVNDIFCLQGWDICLSEFIVIVYDRWGEKVFESKDPNFCWDGTYKSKLMDSQVFVYYIKAKYTHTDKEIIKEGNISLIK